MTEKQQEQEKPVELDDQEIEQVAGGKKPVGVVGDPCAGGEYHKP